MKSSRFKLIISVFAICGVFSLVITSILFYRYQSKRSKILGLSDFSSPIQVISNISGGFPEPDSSFDNPEGITTDTQGNIYVADSGNNRIQKYDIGTTSWTAMGSQGSEIGQFSYPNGVAIDSNGNIYVSDSNNHRIQKYDIGTTSWTAMGELGNGAGLFFSLSGIVVDTNNNIYVTDEQSHLIQKYDIGTTTWTTMGSYGEETGQFYSPKGIAIDSDNNIYVTDRCNGRVQKYNNILGTWSIIGTSDDRCVSVSLTKTTNILVINIKKFLNKLFNQALAVQLIPQGDFNSLKGIAVDLQGNVYVADSGNNRIQKYDPNTNNWTAMGSGGSEIGQFNEPYGLDADRLGNIYVVDSGNHRIQKYDIGTTTWTAMGSGGSETGQFSWPNGVAIDSNGNIYVADSGNDRIQKYDIGTTTWTTMGNRGAEIGQFSWPNGIVTDSNGNIYVTDSENDRLQKYNIGTSSWAIIGSPGSGAGQFYVPNGITIDSTGNIYVVDSGNHRIQKYDIGTTTWTAMGNRGAEIGQFSYPGGMAIDSNGNIYVADSENNRIQKYDIGTTTWTAIGQYNGPPRYSEVFFKNSLLNKLASLFKNIIRKAMATVSVYFNYPTDLAVDNVGNIYVVDSGNNRIQKLIYYSAPTYTVSYSALDNGFISGTTSQSLSVGQSSTPVVAIGNEGYSFLQWSDGSITNPRFDVVEDDDISLTAEFTNTRTITEVDDTKINNEISREFINIGSTDPTLVSNFTFNINYTFLTGSASIVFPAQTVVAPIGASTVDLTQFRTINNTTEIKTKLDNTISSLQFGIPNINLTFSKPVTVIIPVSSNYNNQTLQVKYHRDGDAENIWNNETTCLIINNNCTFQTTHATTFAVLKNTTQTPNNTSFPANYVQDHNCHSTKPLLTSDLFQIDALSNKAKIYFTPQTDTNDYFISFSSINNNAEEHGERVTLLREGVQSHTIYSLKPNTTYYVKVRGQNGCMPGDWSNIMQFKTNSRIYYRYSAATKTNNFIKKTTNTVKKTIINTWNSIILPKTFGD